MRRDKKPLTLKQLPTWMQSILQDPAFQLRGGLVYRFATNGEGLPTHSRSTKES